MKHSDVLQELLRSFVFFGVVALCAAVAIEYFRWVLQLQ